MQIRFSARTHVGMRREVNQDAYGSGAPGAATLLVVCDGMGGHAAGEVASSLGVETIIATYRQELPPDDALREAFTAANRRIYGEGHGSMGTTGVAALFLRNSLHVANVGDSRAYLVREDKIAQISHDHSFVSDQVAAGLMTPEQARSSNVRNIITRALGHSAEVEVDVFTVGLRPGDTVILSSDGMHGLITDEEIAEVAGMLPLEEAAQRLVDTANERGGTDNITVVIARVDELDAGVAASSDSVATTPLAAPPTQRLPETLPAPPAERPLSRLGAALAALTLVALLGIGGYVVFASGTRSPAAPNPPAAIPGTSAPARSPVPTTESPTRPTAGSVAPARPTAGSPTGPTAVTAAPTRPPVTRPTTTPGPTRTP